MLLMTVLTASSISMLNTALAPEPDDTPGDALGCLLAAGLDPDAGHLDGALPRVLTGVAGTLLLHEVAVLPGLSRPTGRAWTTAVFVAPLLFHVLRRSVHRTHAPGGARAESGAAAGLWLGCGFMVGEFVRGGNSGNEWLIAEPGYMFAFLTAGAAPAVWSAQCVRLELAVARRALRGAAAQLN